LDVIGRSANQRLGAKTHQQLPPRLSSDKHIIANLTSSPQFSIIRPQRLRTMSTDTPSHDEHYHSKDALSPSLDAALKIGFIGAVFSGVQASLTKQNIGIFGAFTKYGATTAVFGNFHISPQLNDTALTDDHIFSQQQRPVVPTCSFAMSAPTFERKTTTSPQRSVDS
jgi:hypothetical protein